MDEAIKIGNTEMLRTSKEKITLDDSTFSLVIALKELTDKISQLVGAMSR